LKNVTTRKISIVNSFKDIIIKYHFLFLAVMNTNLLFLTLICFIGMVSPGPDFLLVTKNSLLHAQRFALATALGIITGCLFHATYCILGLAFIITQNAIVYSTLKYLGACYLIYLGIKSVKGSESIPQKQEIDPKEMTVFKAYSEGLLCNALNPKLAIFLLSLFTQFVPVDATIAEKTIVAGIFVGESLLYWPLLVFFLQSSWIRNSVIKSQLLLSRIFGGLLIGLGFSVLFRSD
jgi:threonine/homoserine/homoserine lactone efflux protein